MHKFPRTINKMTSWIYFRSHLNILVWDLVSTHALIYASSCHQMGLVLCHIFIILKHMVFWVKVNWILPVKFANMFVIRCFLVKKSAYFGTVPSYNWTHTYRQCSQITSHNIKWLVVHLNKLCVCYQGSILVADCIYFLLEWLCPDWWLAKRGFHRMPDTVSYV
jgi:hypothetical protein